mmetsp:Transcript_2727/g.7532  ORF Transcript_2727/g.7532 Transcript_2727/m.7532 type:complete len:223 (+) Transcript_2727:1229-1897(+)
MPSWARHRSPSAPTSLSPLVLSADLWRALASQATTRALRAIHTRSRAACTPGWGWTALSCSLAIASITSSTAIPPPPSSCSRDASHRHVRQSLSTVHCARTRPSTCHEAASEARRVAAATRRTPASSGARASLALWCGYVRWCGCGRCYAADMAVVKKCPRGAQPHGALPRACRARGLTVALPCVWGDKGGVDRLGSPDQSEESETESERDADPRARQTGRR